MSEKEYGVATMCRLPKCPGFVCKRALLFEIANWNGGGSCFRSGQGGKGRFWDHTGVFVNVAGSFWYIGLFCEHIGFYWAWKCATIASGFLGLYLHFHLCYLVSAAEAVSGRVQSIFGEFPRCFYPINYWKQNVSFEGPGCGSFFADFLLAFFLWWCALERMHTERTLVFVGSRCSVELIRHI